MMRASPSLFRTLLVTIGLIGLLLACAFLGATQ